MNYSLEQLKELNNKVNGKFSIVYPLIKERIMDYSYMDIPFREEFLFFEDKYLPIAVDLVEKNNELPIIDIGCQYGFQSEFLKNYTGIDISEMKFFNQEREDVNYILSDFMKTDMDLSKSVVLSIMSLGYFNTYISKELSDSQINEMIVEKLSKAPKLYISTTESVHDLLEKKYKSKTLIYNSNRHAFTDGRIIEEIGQYSVYLYE